MRAPSALVACALALCVAFVACGPRADAPPSAPRPTAAAEPDLDGDGIPDRLDMCPNVPEDCDGFEDKDGCPEPDNDHDGIPDVCDLCPNEPETKNGIQDEDGCPEPAVLAPGRGDPVVTFGWHESKLDGHARSVLAAVAQALKADATIERLAVLGHVAPDEPRREHLAAERAEAARVALVALGVAAARLEAHGVGDRMPRVPENDPAHAENRRASFAVLRSRGIEHARFSGGTLVSTRAPAPADAVGAGKLCPGGYPPRPARPCR